MEVKSHRDLQVWKSSMDLVVAVYKLTANFPGTEKYGLSSQLQRAVVSVPANIAEGYGRRHRKEYLRFISIAHGSLLEAETHLLIALRPEYITRENLGEIWNLIQDVGKMLLGLRRALMKNSDA
jgi:four helix bundle protein